MFFIEIIYLDFYGFLSLSEISVFDFWAAPGPRRPFQRAGEEALKLLQGLFRAPDAGDPFKGCGVKLSSFCKGFPGSGDPSTCAQTPTQDDDLRPA